MLTFFRRIRKGLLGTGATRKYLVYAVGEVLLVMIGILLALQVNNWNERQKQKQTEINLIRELTGEMKQNINLLQRSLIIHQRHDLISNNILNNWSELNNDEKIITLRETRQYWTTDLLSGVMKAIISEHGLTIISDDSLRQFISSWDDKKNDFYENEELEAHLVHDRLFPLMSEYISLKQVESYIDGELIEKQRIIVESGLMESIASLVSSKDFENLLIQREFNRYWCIVEIEDLKEELSRAIVHAEGVTNQYEGQ